MWIASKVSDAYSDRSNWARMSIRNSARVGGFSSDRSIREYCRDICKVRPITPDEDEHEHADQGHARRDIGF